MGMERSFQAVPGNSSLVDRARADRPLGELLFLAPFYFKQGLGPDVGPTTPATAELRRIIRGLVAAEPALATRNCGLDRRWDQIRYLLSGQYRGGPAGADDVLLDVSVEGGAGIADHVRGGQGYPVRHTPPDTVAQVARAFERLDIGSLEPHYDLAAMEARGVYKAFAGRETREDWEYLRELIAGLRAFYLEAAKAGDEVLVCTD